MGTGEVTPLHEGWRYKTFESHEIGNLIYGTATVNFCHIVVPLDHILRKATFACALNAQAGTTTLLKLQRAINGGVVADIAAWTNLVTKTAVFIEDHVSEESTFGDEVGPAMYAIELDGDDAGDDFTTPMLTIMVSPIPPGPA